jgi:hypothetical protein
LILNMFPSVKWTTNIYTPELMVSNVGVGGFMVVVDIARNHKITYVKKTYNRYTHTW